MLQLLFKLNAYLLAFNNKKMSYAIRKANAVRRKRLLYIEQLKTVLKSYIVMLNLNSTPPPPHSNE